jgi:hypothetical protein
MRGALREIRRGRAVTAVAAATSLVLLSLLAGCSATGVVEKAKLVEPLVYASVLGDEESNFEGRLLQVVIEGLATGASEQAGGDAYGNILSLLGWGGSGSDNYGRMQQTLNDVDAGIVEIKTELSAMQSQLEMSTDEIIANTNDPTAAITEITTYDDELQELSANGTPGKGDQRSILAFAERWGRDAAALLLAQHPDVDAIACGSDQIARGVLDTLRDLDRRVPEEVAVIGYDNWEALTTNSRPELTSIDANLQQLGREAARSLFQAMGSTANKPHGIEHLPVRLIIRGSTIPHR